MRKTTLELSDALLRDAKKIAAAEGTTVKALVEQGLRLVILQRQKRRGFTLRRASFEGDGLAAGESLQDWAAIRARIYVERGA
jgi:hypothetical protein